MSLGAACNGRLLLEQLAGHPRGALVKMTAALGIPRAASGTTRDNLAAGARSASRRLRVWCGQCAQSTGQEDISFRQRDQRRHAGHQVLVDVEPPKATAAAWVASYA